ncbi:MAG: TIGR01777 family oxidoreductase [Candidatus Marinarcus sp.]|uniref:TIGR01777 family oxidoreductase n=1 Tax=Candidatus Marinarcus sp. TaxID=3100987 RepID=UPI003B0089EB
MKTIAITGASGFVGTHLTHFFKELGYEVLKISRAELLQPNVLEVTLSKTDIVINLAGANIIHRWTESYKKELYSSRIDTTKALVTAIKTISNKPKVFISTSAVGIYSNKQINSEDDFEYAEGFLATLCQTWEEEALKAKENTRVCIFRFGIVLGKDGGALQSMLPPFKLGLGGTIGNGNQYFSFIHIDDLMQAFKFVIEKETLEGAFNLAAPTPTTNKGLTLALGKTLKKPTFLPVPPFVLRLIFSEGATVLTDGQSMIPKRLEESGFKFTYQNIEETIENLLGEKQ